MALPLWAEVFLSRDWALYNPLKNWTLFGLSENELRLILLTLTDNEMKLAQFCKKGDSKWTDVRGAQLTELMDPDHRLNYSDSEGFPAATSQGGFETDTDILKTKQDEKIQYPRLHHRKEIAIPCKIANAVGSKEFVTQTVDLSEGGLKFKNTIPDWIAGYFIVLVDSKFELMCSIVEDQREKTRVQIVSQENDPQFLHYREWLQTL